MRYARKALRTLRLEMERWEFVVVMLIAGALLLGVEAGKAQGPPGDACDPEIRQGLMENAAAGVQGDLAVIRNPDQGIRNPDSILDLSCLEELFDFGGFDLFYDPGASMQDLLGLLQRQVCAVARNAYGGYLGRTLDVGAMAWELERVPGVDVDRRQRNFLHEPVRAGDPGVNLENFRNSLGGE